jgi:hypothetical protein
MFVGWHLLNFRLGQRVVTCDSRGVNNFKYLFGGLSIGLSVVKNGRIPEGPTGFWRPRVGRICGTIR